MGSFRLIRMSVALGLLAVATCWATASAGTPPLGWKLETIDAPRWYAGHGIGYAVDGTGHPHLAYGGDQLVHAWHDGAHWRFEVVDASAGSGGAATLAIGSDGSMHIAYSGPNGELRYALRFAGTWFTSTLDGTVDCTRLDMALDAADEPHIAYVNDDDNWLYLMIDQGNGAWEREQLVRAYSLSRPPAVAVAGYSTKVLYERASPSGPGWELGYVYWGGSAWVDELAASGTGLMNGCDLVLDSANQPRLAVTGGISTDSRIYYGYRDATGWHLSTAASSTETYSSVTIALDGSGQPMITSRQLDLGCALHRRTCSPICFWSHEYLDSGHSVGSDATVRMIGTTPSVAFINWDESEIRLARRGASAWNVETVDVLGDVDLPSIVVDDATRLVHVSYGDVLAGALRYAQRYSGGWFHTVLDRTPTVPPHSSIDLDTVGDPHIAYTCRMSNGTFMLRWAVDNGNGYWEWYDVTTLGPSDGVPSLKLDGGSPRISFYDAANQDLNYGSKSSGWSFTAVDTGPATGALTALALDADGLPHIAYTAGNPRVLKHAWKQCSTICWWSTEVVDDSVEVGAVSIALDPLWGRPRIAYYDVTHHDLRYAAKFSGGWAPPQTLDSVGDVGAGCAIDLELALPHISYVDVGNGDLKRAWQTCDGVDCTWNVEVVDDSGTIGGQTSIAVDALGHVHVAYEDTGRRDVLYAVRSGGEIFIDDFESGSLSRWSSHVP